MRSNTLALVTLLCAIGVSPAARAEPSASFAATTAPDRLASDNVLDGFQLGPVAVSTPDGAMAAQYVDDWNACPATSDAIGSPCYQWTLMPRGLIYRSYLAGPKESRIRGVWNDEANDGDIWDITLGGRAGLLRYGYLSQGRPVGWQLDIEGAGEVRLDLDEESDVTATDYRFGIPLTWGDTHSQMKFAYYHVSSHLGDEFLLKNPGYPRLNYVRDVLLLGYSLTPTPWWRYYFEIGYGVHVDIADPWELQFGIDYAPPGATGFRGSPFFAVNGYLREEVNYGGSFATQAGWAWRRSPTSGMFRAGVEYYNGKDDQFSFFDDSVQKVGFGLWYDY